MFNQVDAHPVHCVICDDVRIEVGGKEIIIGAYPTGMSFPFVPWAAVVCLRVAAIWSGEGERDLEIRVLNPLNRQVGEMSGRASAVWQGWESSLIFRGLSFSVEMEGVYDFQWKRIDDTWQSLRRFPIYIPKTTSP